MRLRAAVRPWRRGLTQSTLLCPTHAGRFSPTPGGRVFSYASSRHAPCRSGPAPSDPHLQPSSACVLCSPAALSLSYAIQAGSRASATVYVPPTAMCTATSSKANAWHAILWTCYHHHHFRCRHLAAWATHGAGLLPHRACYATVRGLVCRGSRWGSVDERLTRVSRLCVASLGWHCATHVACGGCGCGGDARVHCETPHAIRSSVPQPGH